MIEAYFDGLCEPKNPNGTAAYGYVIFKDGKEIKSGCKVVGSGVGMTNNVAEYSAIKRAIEWLVENNIENEDIILKGDSNLVVQQLNGNWSIRSNTSQKFVSEIKPLLKRLTEKNKVQIIWIPREQNEKADMLSRVAYKRLLKEEVTDF